MAEHGGPSSPKGARVRPTPFGCAFACGLSVLICVGCAGKKADFGTLPQVSVPIEKEPEQDPTLFREDKQHSLPLPTSDPPDPRPLRTRHHFDFVIAFDKGNVKLVSVKEVHLKQPQSTARRLGRFAFELWSGTELVERVRFDFPLLGASRPEEDDPLGAGLSASTRVRVPASSRASHARILDRKTRDEVEVPWPPISGENTAPNTETGEEDRSALEPPPKDP